MSPYALYRRRRSDSYICGQLWLSGSESDQLYRSFELPFGLRRFGRGADRKRILGQRQQYDGSPDQPDGRSLLRILRWDITDHLTSRPTKAAAKLRNFVAHAKRQLPGVTTGKWLLRSRRTGAISEIRELDLRPSSSTRHRVFTWKLLPDGSSTASRWTLHPPSTDSMRVTSRHRSTAGSQMLNRNDSRG